MDWIFEHLQLLVVVGGAIAYWLNQRRKSADDAEEPPAQSQRRETLDGDQEDAAAQIRRIQEEIRRKILQRNSGTEAPPPIPAEVQRPRSRFESEDEETPRPAGTWQPEPPPLSPYDERQAETPPVLIKRSERMTAYDAGETERQRQLSDELHRLEERRRETRHLVEEIQARTAQPTHASEAPRPGVPALQQDLRHPASLRRAIVLREILGPPVALR